MSGVRTSQSDASSDMDLARAPRRTARQPRSQGFSVRTRGEHPRPQAEARAALTVAPLNSWFRLRGSGC